MIMRGSGASGAVGLAGTALWTCICTTLFAGGCAASGALPACAAGTAVVTRGGTAIAGGAAPAEAAGAVATGGVAGILGGITTTDGGRYVAATEAGVTILDAGGAGAWLAGWAGFGFAVATGASVLASTAGTAAGGLTAARAAGGSTTAFC
jgi:hypothetical protein